MTYVLDAVYRMAEGEDRPPSGRVVIWACGTEETTVRIPKSRGARCPVGIVIGWASGRGGSGPVVRKLGIAEATSSGPIRRGMPVMADVDGRICEAVGTPDQMLSVIGFAETHAPQEDWPVKVFLSRHDRPGENPEEGDNADSAH